MSALGGKISSWSGAFGSLRHAIRRNAEVTVASERRIGSVAGFAVLDGAAERKTRGDCGGQDSLRILLITATIGNNLPRPLSPQWEGHSLG